MNFDRFTNFIVSELAASAEAIEGFKLLIEEGERRKFGIESLAYVLATTYWETARTMQPVREAYYLGNFNKAEAWRKKNLRYYPYYGRGYVQLTHDYNYKKAGDFFGIDMVSDPDLALDPKYAVPIIFEGMDNGWFTGKKLDDYIDDEPESDNQDLEDYRRARRIINGTDKDSTIALIAQKIESFLMDSGYPAHAGTVSAHTATPGAAAGDSFEEFIGSLNLKFFKPYEFLVKGNAHGNPDSPAFGLNTDPPKSLWPNIVSTARAIDEFRGRIKLPVVLTSVYRSPAYNAAIGGATASRHMEFDAIDFVVKGSTVGPVEWAQILKDMRSDGFFSGGIGVYSSFVHVDTRGTNVNF
ncbi:MAG: D-Ala-D-Ala carboxypeptidase family metallohydrolase [Pseudomonadota bacterium]